VWFQFRFSSFKRLLQFTEDLQRFGAS
jgi:hypothetical protein